MKSHYSLSMLEVELICEPRSVPCNAADVQKNP